MATPQHTWIDRLSQWVGSTVSWLTVVLVCIVFIDVVLRYAFDYSQNWILELQWHVFACILLLGLGYTLRHDQHVRVDVFYADWSPTVKAVINLGGAILLLLPWCLLIIQTGTDYTVNSWMMREGSDQPGGLPARYLIKGVIVLGFVLLLLQGLSEAYRSLRKLLRK